MITTLEELVLVGTVLICVGLAGGVALFIWTVNELNALKSRVNNLEEERHATKAQG